MFKNLVVEDILSDYSNQETPYSSLLATSNIQDAMKYFNIFENHIENSENEKIKNFKFTVLFTKTENNEESPQKIEVHEEFFEKLYSKYEADFDQKIYEYSEFKKDISTRLKRKKEGKVLDLLIVVNQMLTGFDSKYIQTVYFDKTPKSYELIQNVSRTNRKLLHSNKKYGRSFFYRKPNHMKQEVQESFKKYSFQNLEEISAKKLEEHFPDINKNFQEISNLLTDLNLKW
ncbi:Type-1 restriction enzyme R protein, partial [Mycoplasmopsis edwardii]